MDRDVYDCLAQIDFASPWFRAILVYDSLISHLEFNECWIYVTSVLDIRGINVCTHQRLSTNQVKKVHNILRVNESAEPLLLTWINVNPNMDK